jgi:hypothetical protein
LADALVLAARDFQVVFELPNLSKQRVAEFLFVCVRVRRRQAAQFGRGGLFVLLFPRFLRRRTGGLFGR